MSIGQGALSDIRVIDFGHVLAGPVAAMILCDLGAEVIHVEPFTGDDSRQFGPFINGQSAYFVSINRGKKSITVNMKNEKGKEVIEKLLRISDVCIENFRPGVMDNLGLSYERIRKLNPRIIYASISGFGHDALPGYRGKPAYDLLAQAYSGLISITGTDEGKKVRVGSSIGDIMTGHQCVISVLAALHHREITGQGQRIDQAMVDGLVYILENAVVRYGVEDEIPKPLGTKHPTITPFQSFETKDGEIVAAVGNDKLWACFCRAVNVEEWIEDDRFRNNAQRTQNRDVLIALLKPMFKERSTAEWQKRLDEEGVPNSAINTMAEVVRDANLKHRKMFVDIDQPTIGTLTITGSPFKLSLTPGEVRSRAPSLGEHTREILSSLLHYSEEEIKALIEKGAVLAGASSS